MTRNFKTQQQPGFMIIEVFPYLGIAAYVKSDDNRDADLQRPSITIIISNYNQAEFLDDSLLGIAEQTNRQIK